MKKLFLFSLIFIIAACVPKVPEEDQQKDDYEREKALLLKSISYARSQLEPHYLLAPKFQNDLLVKFERFYIRWTVTEKLDISISKEEYEKVRKALSAVHDRESLISDAYGLTEKTVEKSSYPKEKTENLGPSLTEIIFFLLGFILLGNIVWFFVKKRVKE